MIDLILHVINEYIQANKAIIGLVILGFLFAGFIMERFPAAVVAVLGACMFLFLGIIDSDGLFSVFSNTAPITIAAMFILSGALLRTGTIDAIAGFIIKRAKHRPKLAVAEMFLGAFVASAFMNNTPVVIVLIPIILRLSRATGFSSKKLLIPLSFICILGGTTTLIGTSTNLIVDAVAREQGLAGFGIFEITPYGLIAAVAGTVMMVLFSSWLLPGGNVKGEFDSSDESAFLTELTVRRNASVIDKKLYTVPELRRAGLEVTAVKRLSSYIRHDLDFHELRAGDRIVVQLDLAELISLRESEDFKVGIVRKGDVGALGEELVEATVAPSHPAIGSRLYDIPFLSQLNVRVLGMTRYRNLPRSDLTNARIHAADRLLVTGSSEDIRRRTDQNSCFPPGSCTDCHWRAGCSGGSCRAQHHSAGGCGHIGRWCDPACPLYRRGRSLGFDRRQCSGPDIRYARGGSGVAAGGQRRSSGCRTDSLFAGSTALGPCFRYLRPVGDHDRDRDQQCGGHYHHPDSHRAGQ